MTRPVLVLQHLVDDGPAYLATWLAGVGVPMDLRCTEAGQDFPRSVSGHRALAILGGAMSANDELPSLRQAEALIREAVSLGVPVIGHCLGGQLMARALGGAVGASPAPEIGWQAIHSTGQAASRSWFGDEALPPVFQWHYEAFSLPAGSQALAASPACPHQAFSVGPHLAMQFHVEQDARKLARWAAQPDPGYADALRRHPVSVQALGAMLAQADQALRCQQALADRLYQRWLSAAAS